MKWLTDLLKTNPMLKWLLIGIIAFVLWNKLGKKKLVYRRKRPMMRRMKRRMYTTARAYNRSRFRRRSR